MFPGMFSAYPVESLTPPKPLGDPNKPVACVQRAPGATWCGHPVVPGPFLFTDAKYAVEHYSNVKGRGLRVCPDCAIAIAYSS